MRRALGIVTGVLGALAIAVAVGPAAPASRAAADAPPARLAGSFSLSGRITDARYIPGERSGQVVSRVWSFAPRCASGGCDQVDLTRPRPRGSDRVLLTRVRTGVYTGQGSFFAPLRCGRRLARPGERVTFAITVAVAAVRPIGGVPTVTRIAATYASTSRVNLTRCVAFLGHDSARYHGALLPG